MFKHMKLLVLVTAAALAVTVHATTKPGRYAVESGQRLEFVQVLPQTVTYEGQKALRLEGVKGHNGEALALVTGSEFTDGTIDVDLAGRPAAGSDAGARGFVGIAFRSAAHAAAFECFYLRPTNGRADDQLRRNHSTQYISAPDYPWERLRTQAPACTSPTWIWSPAPGRT